ncbi:MAG: hypothetical protein ACI86S_001836, partial [Paracoccaceae bacterium]
RLLIISKTDLPACDDVTRGFFVGFETIALEGCP